MPKTDIYMEPTIVITPSSRGSSGNLMTVPFPAKVQNVRFINNPRSTPLGKLGRERALKPYVHLLIVHL